MRESFPPLSASNSSSCSSESPWGAEPTLRAQQRSDRSWALSGLPLAQRVPVASLRTPPRQLLHVAAHSSIHPSGPMAYLHPQKPQEGCRHFKTISLCKSWGPDGQTLTSPTLPPLVLLPGPTGLTHRCCSFSCISAFIEMIWPVWNWMMKRNNQLQWKCSCFFVWQSCNQIKELQSRLNWIHGRTRHCCSFPETRHCKFYCNYCQCEPSSHWNQASSLPSNCTCKSDVWWSPQSDASCICLGRRFQDRCGRCGRSCWQTGPCPAVGSRPGPTTGQTGGQCRPKASCWVPQRPRCSQDIH